MNSIRSRGILEHPYSNSNLCRCLETGLSAPNSIIHVAAVACSQFRLTANAKSRQSITPIRGYNLMTIKALSCSMRYARPKPLCTALGEDGGMSRLSIFSIVTSFGSGS